MKRFQTLESLHDFAPSVVSTSSHFDYCMQCKPQCIFIRHDKLSGSGADRTCQCFFSSHEGPVAKSCHSQAAAYYWQASSDGILELIKTIWMSWTGFALSLANNTFAKAWKHQQYCIFLDVNFALSFQWWFPCEARWFRLLRLFRGILGNGRWGWADETEWGIKQHLQNWVHCFHLILGIGKHLLSFPCFLVAHWIDAPGLPKIKTRVNNICLRWVRWFLLRLKRMFWLSFF